MKNNEKIFVLVTGATGFLGRRIVAALSASGFRIRVLVRKTSRLEIFEKYNVDIAVGDMGDLESLRHAFDGVDCVVHAAADTSGTVEGGKTITIKGTQTIIDLCKTFGIKKLVYISSASVYGVAAYKNGDRVNEESPLERFPEKRGAYSSAKFQAEQIVLEAMRQKECPIICLRPGTIYGPGGEIYTPMMGFSFKNKLFLTIGKGKFILPLVYVDNVADAVRAAMENTASHGKVFNLIDPYQLTKKQYIRLLLKKIYPGALFLTLPYRILYLFVYAQEVLFNIIHTPPFLTRYRLESSQKEIVYSGEKICTELDWIPPVSLEGALSRMVEYELERKN